MRCKSNQGPLLNAGEFDLRIFYGRDSKAKRQFSDRNRAVLMNVQSPDKWWSILKSAVFGMSSSLLPLVSEGGGLLCESVGRMICCWIILTASSPRRLLICRSLTIRLVLPPLPSGRER